MATKIARLGFLTALALNSVNLGTDIKTLGIDMSRDSVHRYTVFDNLNAAMGAAGKSPADILRQQTELTTALTARKGYITFEEGTYIYNPIVDDKTNFNFDNTSQEEISFFQEMFIIFYKLKNAIGGTIQLVQGMNLWEQLNALLLTSGLITFVTQCVKGATACVELSRSLGSIITGATYNGVNYAYSLLRGVPTTASASASASAASAPTTVAQQEIDAATRQAVLKALEDTINQIELNEKLNVGATLTENLALIDMTKVTSDIIKLSATNSGAIDANRIRYQKNGQPYTREEIDAREDARAKKAAEKAAARAARIAARDAAEEKYDRYDEETLKKPDREGRYGGRRKSKRRHNKTKSSKRRRHKTKKRVYRSTRFRSRK